LVFNTCRFQIWNKRRVSTFKAENITELLSFVLAFQIKREYLSYKAFFIEVFIFFNNYIGAQLHMSLGGMGGWGGLNHTPLEMFETSHDLPKSAEKFSKFFLPLPQISLRNLARHVGDH
jgi:hypothetical protein